MDVGFFLRDRIAFIRQFYDAASSPFLERKRKIEAREDPFVPPYSEDGEPPFVTEWIEADESLQILGYSCISMLAAALHLYLMTWVVELGVPVGDSFNAEFKKGWINGYRAYFSTRFGIQFENSPADGSLLEEIALARNRIQHPDHIATQRPDYSASDLAKLPRVFFISETERGLFSDLNAAQIAWVFPPSVHITRETLIAAIEEVEKFAAWLEEQISERVP
jgi:hypothetical protein